MYSVNKKKCEVLGLVFLLIAFGWQCWHEYRQETQIKAIMYEFNQQIFCIHSLVYNDVLKQDYYTGEEMFCIREDMYKPMNYDWCEVQQKNSNIDRESEWAFKIRVMFYVIGSVLIIVSKSNNVCKPS